MTAPRHGRHVHVVEYERFPAVTTGDVMEAKVLRRKFIVSSVAALGTTSLSAASYGRILGANLRIGVGFVDYGPIGKRHVADFKREQDVELIAISDAHRSKQEAGRAAMGQNATGYSGFRKLLDDRCIDAVVNPTPDQWHALQTMLACAAGKDVYVEKPLTLVQREGHWMIDVAARNKRVVQVGTQQRSGKHYQRARDLLSDGRLGKIHAVRARTARNFGEGVGNPADRDPPPRFPPIMAVQETCHVRTQAEAVGERSTSR